MPFRHPIEVRFSDIDVMRHVNNAAYFTYLEQAWVAFWRRLTGSNRVEDIDFILAHAECDYRRPITFGDSVEVSFRIGGFGRSSLTVQHEIRDPKGGGLFATAKTVLVMYDYARHAPVTIPDDLRKRMVDLTDRSQHMVEIFGKDT